MYRTLLVVLSSFVILCLDHTVAAAGTADVQPDGSAAWHGENGIDGIGWNPDGSIRRVYSRYSTPVEFADRRGIMKAQVVAEEKAKAEIIRFMKQDLASSRVVTEIQNDLNKATQQRDTGAPANVKKVDERTLIENLTEITGSFASGTLSGVIVLERGYSEKTEEAWVVVGISDNTIQAARDVAHMTAGAQHPDANPGAVPPAQTGSIKTQPSEVRSANQKEW